MEPQIDLLGDEPLNNFRRRDLLPWWIKIFIWIFLAFGLVVPVAIIFGIMGNNFHISIYGIGANDPFSLIGGGLLIIFLLKALVAYELWTEKDQAVNLGIVDAAIGIPMCIFVMFISPFLSSQRGFRITIRLELILLIPYLLKLLRLRSLWDTADTI